MHEEVAERRVVLGIVGKIPSVLEPTPGEQDGVVARIVGAGVAQVAAKQGRVWSSNVPPASRLVFMAVRNSSKQPMMARSILSNCSMRLGSRP